MPDTLAAFRLTEEQILLRDAVRTLADEKIEPRAAEIDRTAEFPWDVEELLASHDILALPFPEEYGGIGADLLTVCLAIEAISHACATSGLMLAVHELSSLPIMMAGTDEQKQRWLPDLAAGRKLIAFALTEASAGSDPSATTTRAVRDGDDYVIDGSKRFISHASVADLVIVFAVTNPEAARASPDVVLRRRDGPAGLRRRPTRAQDGHSRLAHGRAHLRWPARAGHEPDRRGGRGVLARHADVRALAARGSPPRRSESPRARSMSPPATPANGASSTSRSASCR